MTDRPKIPREIRRCVLVEAGHRCAVPNCGQTELELHHIEPWAKRKEHRQADLIALCRNCHARAERGEIDAKSLRIYKARLLVSSGQFTRFELDYMVGLAETGGHPRQLSLEMTGHIASAVDAGFLMWWGEQRIGVPGRYFACLTEKGCKFLNDSGLVESPVDYRPPPPGVNEGLSKMRNRAEADE